MPLSLIHIYEVVYAPVHNWGGEIDVTVTDRMRRFAWASLKDIY